MRNDKLMKARCRLLSKEPFYGTFALMFDWIPSEMEGVPDEFRTMGVRMVNGGRVECLYYPPFVEGKTVEQLYGIVKHEIEHIVRLHPVRVGKRYQQAWNIACDMCVNGRKEDPRCIYVKPNKEVIVPSDKMVNIPSNWPDNLSAEEYYDRIPKICAHCGRSLDDHRGSGQKGGKGQGGGKGQKQDKQENGKEDKQENGEGQGEEGEGEGNSQGEGQGKNDGGGSGGCPYCSTLDNHQIWKSSNVSEDEARQVVKDMCDQAVTKSRGNTPGHLEASIEALNKPIVKWRTLLKQYLGRHMGNRRWTYSRRNRRRDEFGLKGISHRAAAEINVIIDTSGSISKDELEQFFAEIEMMTHRTKVSILQWDHAFQGYDASYRRGDWKKINVHGRGGTDMVAPFKWLEDNKLIKDATVMLTDGECSWPEKKNYPIIFCITTDREGPKWGTSINLDIR